MFTMMRVVAAAVTLLQMPGAPDSEGTRTNSVLERVSVDHTAIDNTIEALEQLDAQGQDGVVLWIGVIEERRARVLLAVVLVHDAADTEAADSSMSPDMCARINHALAKSGLRLIAEVRSSTTTFRDSDLSSRDVVADSDGALALIVSSQSRESDPTKWTGYRRFNGGWRSLSGGQMQKLLGVDLE
jgi:hypothetical protein